MLCFWRVRNPVSGRVKPLYEPIPRNFLTQFPNFFFDPYFTRVCGDLGLHRPPIRLIHWFSEGINGIPRTEGVRNGNEKG
jgi:hypothetical protein